MKIAITGCAGYIGSALTQYLLESHSCIKKIIGIDSLLYKNNKAIDGFINSDRFEFLKTDCTNYNYKDVDVVVHLAALVGAPACDKAGETLTRATNITAVDAIVRQLGTYQSIVYPNTNSGYGVGGSTYCDEDSPLRPISSYGKSKVAGEEIVLSHNKGTSLRLATVFGVSPRPRYDLLVNNWVYQLYRNNKLEIFEKDFRRNFVGIKDICRVFSYFIFHPQNDMYNVGLPDANLTKEELANTIVEALRDFCYDFHKPTITFGSGKDPDQRDYIVSNDKLLSKGFVFQQSLYDGISDILSHIDLKNGNLSMGNI